jgi:hypothetical protein
VEHRAQ